MNKIPVLAQLLRLARRLYEWMLAFADKPHATQALFGLSFIESSFFPLPPDPLLMAMGAHRQKRAIWYAFITTLGSVLGAVLGFVIGHYLMASVGQWLLDFYDPELHTWNKIEAWFEEYGLMALLLAAVTPIPFKIFTIFSGAMAGVGFWPFLGACIVGRSFRFFIEGILLYFYGAPIVRWMDKWFDIVAIVFAVLLVGGFVALKYL